MNNPLNRRPGESAKAFQACKIYIELGVNRSMAEVAIKLDKSHALISRWSARWQWNERAVEWDHYMLEREKQEQERALEASAKRWAERQNSIRERAWANAEALIAKADAMLKMPIVETRTEDGRTVIKPVRFSFGDASRMYEVADKLSRLALGVPTERTEHTGLENAPITVNAPQVRFNIVHNGRDPVPTPEEAAKVTEKKEAEEK